MALASAAAHTVQRASVWAGSEVARISRVARHAVAGAIDALAFVRAARRAVPRSTVVACPTVVTHASILGAGTMAAAVVLARLFFAANALPSIHACARSIGTLATAAAVHGAAAFCAVLSVVGALACTCAVAAVAVTDATAAVVLRAVALKDFTCLAVKAGTALAGAIAALATLVALVKAELNAAVDARVQLSAKTLAILTHAVAVAVLGAHLGVAIHSLKAGIALASSALCIAQTVATAQFACCRVACTLFDTAVITSKAWAALTGGIQQVGVHDTGSVVLARR